MSARKNNVIDTSKIVFQKGIPIPPRRSGDKWGEVLQRMKIGECFDVRCHQAGIRNAAKKHDIEVHVGTLGAVNHIRVWRLS